MAKRDVVRRIDFDGYAGASPKGVTPVSGLTADQIQDMIDDAIEENNNSGGGGGGGGGAITMSVSPGTGLIASGYVGNDFTIHSVVYTLENTSSVAINWTVTKSRSWVTVSSASGTLAVSATTTVTVSFAASASELAAGEYTDFVVFDAVAS